jgi:hypothetical protein
MKKGLVYGALCALALAAPAAAETFYLPILGTHAAGGNGLTKVRAVDTDDAGQVAFTEKAGMVAIDLEELYQAGTDVQLADLPKPRAMRSLLVGAANLSEKGASCQATLIGRDGSRVGDSTFYVEPMSLVRRDGLAAAGGGRVFEVRVTCDQSFYPFAIATDGSGKGPIIAKGIGPNGACNSFLTMVKQSTGHYITVGPPGVFHEATKAAPKGIVCIRVPEELRIGKAVFEWDTISGPWSTRDRSGLHNLGYFFLDRYRSGVVGNINVAGPNKSFLKFMQNVGMTRGSNTNNKVKFVMQTGVTYHQVYTFDAAKKTATMQVFLNGAQVSSVTKNTSPGNNQALVIRPFGTGILTGLGMTAEFGNYLGQHHPEEASIGWKFANFKIDMTPK